MEGDFIKNGTNEEDMRGGVQDHPNVHHYHAHDKECNDLGHCLHVNEHEKEEDEHEEKHGEAKMPTEMNEHTEPEEIKDRDEVGNHAGAYPGMIRKLR